MHHLRGAMQYWQAPLPNKGMPLKRLLQNLAWEGVPSPHHQAKSHRYVALKNMGLQP